MGFRSASSTWMVSVRSSESASMIRLPGTSDTASPVSASSRSESDRSCTVVTSARGSRGRRASQPTWTLATTTSQQEAGEQPDHPPRVQAEPEVHGGQREQQQDGGTDGDPDHDHDDRDGAPQCHPDEHEGGHRHQVRLPASAAGDPGRRAPGPPVRAVCVLPSRPTPPVLHNAGRRRHSGAQHGIDVDAAIDDRRRRLVGQLVDRAPRRTSAAG